MNQLEQDYYEFEGFWNSEEFNRSNLERIEATFALLPEGTGSLLDVACGNGLFCNLVKTTSPRIRVVGLDRSLAALAHVTTEKIQGSITRIPFDSTEFDCVSALQVLEHLTISDFELAKDEISRVAKRHIIVSVPYRQRIEDDYTRCPSCRSIFNSDLHFRTFDDDAVKELFVPEGFTCIRQVKTGKITELLGHRIYSRIFYPENKYRWNSPICPLCGYKDEEFLGKIAVSKASVNLKKSILNRLTKLPKRIWPKSTRFYWIIALYERTATR